MLSLREVLLKVLLLNLATGDDALSILGVDFILSFQTFYFVLDFIVVGDVAVGALALKVLLL